MSNTLRKIVANAMWAFCTSMLVTAVGTVEAKTWTTEVQDSFSLDEVIEILGTKGDDAIISKIERRGSNAILFTNELIPTVAHGITVNTGTIKLVSTSVDFPKLCSTSHSGKDIGVAMPITDSDGNCIVETHIITTGGISREYLKNIVAYHMVVVLSSSIDLKNNKSE